MFASSPAEVAPLFKPFKGRQSINLYAETCPQSAMMTIYAFGCLNSRQQCADAQLIKPQHSPDMDLEPAN
jgi:hypothetical protein